MKNEGTCPMVLDVMTHSLAVNTYDVVTGVPSTHIHVPSVRLSVRPIQAF